MSLKNAPREIQDTIVIERREVIAELTIYQGDGENPIAAAMRITGNYISENMTDSRMSFEFNAFGRLFTIAVDGSEPMEK